MSAVKYLTFPQHKINENKKNPYVSYYMEKEGHRGVFKVWLKDVKKRRRLLRKIRKAIKENKKVNIVIKDKKRKKLDWWIITPVKDAIKVEYPLFGKTQK